MTLRAVIPSTTRPIDDDFMGLRCDRSALIALMLWYVLRILISLSSDD